MEIQIENLRAKMRGVQLNNYQRALALDEYHKLLDYVEKLEQLTIPTVSGRSLMSEFWKESADLIEKYRDSGDERAAQGVVSCRILIDRLMKQLENDR